MWHSSNASWGFFHWVGSASDYMGYNADNGTVAVKSAFEVGLGFRQTTAVNDMPEILEVEAAFLQMTRNNGGEFTWRHCKYTPAVLEYEVHFQSGEMVLPEDTSANPVYAIANNSRQYDTNNPTAQQQTLTSLYEVYVAYSQVNATVVFTKPSPPGQTWNGFPDTLNAYAMQFYNQHRHGETWYDDPLPKIVSSFNNMMVRGNAEYTREMLAGKASPGEVDPGVSPDQRVNGTEKTTLNVFSKDYSWFAAAAVLDLIVILALLPLFRGFWLFPKHPDLSPLELALAFRSPLAADVHSTAGADGVVEAVGSRKIAYGVVEEERKGGAFASPSNRLAFGMADVVRPPQKNATIIA
ncbi:uncharacterized protein LTR77_001239 [Saxophila tyrrhenica]|uniref:Uncharacterized protein n=1 Tax=Saxophila tyrrhenica TaxID=1690608 RepID=A0AAV9PN66_9PEZI|nr:hypothetical protein LTR77_001239 [Saxophila tyrrhenica]